MTHLLPSKSSTLKQKRLIKKYRDRSLRLLEKINPTEKRGVYHQSEATFRGLLVCCFVRKITLKQSALYIALPLVRLLPSRLVLLSSLLTPRYFDLARYLVSRACRH